VDVPLDAENAPRDYQKMKKVESIKINGRCVWKAGSIDEGPRG
jgi:hypothetical protein